MAEIPMSEIQGFTNAYGSPKPNEYPLIPDEIPEIVDDQKTLPDLEEGLGVLLKDALEQSPIEGERKVFAQGVVAIAEATSFFLSNANDQEQQELNQILRARPDPGWDSANDHDTVQALGVARLMARIASRQGGGDSRSALALLDDCTDSLSSAAAFTRAVEVGVIHVQAKNAINAIVEQASADRSVSAADLVSRTVNVYHRCTNLLREKSEATFRSLPNVTSDSTDWGFLPENITRALLTHDSEAVTTFVQENDYLQDPTRAEERASFESVARYARTRMPFDKMSDFVRELQKIASV